MKKPFFARHALIVLMAVFFLAPFALRGARLAVQRMKNDVKDWLPSDFAETRELDWFRDRFLGEQFVVVSWEGCAGSRDDESFMTFVDKFFPPVPPSERLARLHPSDDDGDFRAIEPAQADEQGGGESAAGDALSAEGADDGEPADVIVSVEPADELANDVAREDSAEQTAGVAGASTLSPSERRARAWPVDVRRETYMDERLGMYVRQLQLGDLPAADDHISNKLGLFYTPNEFENWGGLNEKWILGRGDQWYYVTPDGELYRWKGSASILQPLLNRVQRLWRGPFVDGEFVASLGALDGPWYYEDPQRLSARLFKTVTTGPGMLHQLTKPGGVLEHDIDQARERLAGSLFGPDGKQTCLVITLTDAAKQDLRLTLGRGILGKPQGRLLTLAAESGVSPPPPPVLVPPPLSWFLAPPNEPSGPVIKLGGPSVDNVAIDEEGQITLFRLVGLSLVVGIGLAYVSFRSVNVTIMIFLVGGLSAVSSLSFVYWGGQTLDAVLMSMPSLIYVLGLSGAVHIVNYYRDAIPEGGLRRAPGAAVRTGWKPCFYAAFTTSLGLISLYSSNILPIRKFGLYSALGVMATLILLFTYLPAALQTWPPRRFRERSSSAASKSPLDLAIERFWHHVGEWIVNHYGLVTFGSLLLMFGVGAGISRINTDVQLLKMFDADAKIIRDYKWLEQNLGRLVPMEVVVRVDQKLLRDTTQSASEDVAQDPLPLTFLERMEVCGYVQEVLERRFGAEGENLIGHAMSPVTFAVELPGSGSGFRKAAERGGISRSLEGHRNEFLRSEYLRVDREDQAELWRISLRLGALNDVDYGAFVEDLKETIEPVLAAYQARAQILAGLQQQRGEAGLRGARVYLLGAPLGASPSARQRLAKATDADPNSPQTEVAAAQQAAPVREGESAVARTNGRAVSQWSQTAVYAQILRRLLANAGLEVRDWYDPRFAPPEDWSSVLARQDCVVWLDRQVSFDAQRDVSDQKLLVDVRDHIYRRGQGTANERHADVAAVYTGLVPVVYKAQRTLLDSLIVSTISAFGMIAVVMMFVLRNARAGLVSMLPNVFPVLLVFGAMGWGGYVVDIGSMMTASVALGIAVDDTIHFLTWFRRGLDEGLKRRDAILQSYERVAMAMTQTTAIGGLGLSIFAFSTFTPTQRFGTLMLALLATALMGDLLFLPALLASPLGKIFDRPRQKRSSAGAPAVAVDAAPHDAEPHRPGFESPPRKRPYPVSTQLPQNRSIHKP